MLRYRSLREEDGQDKDPLRELQLSIGDSQHEVDDLNYQIKRANDQGDPDQDAITKLRDQLKVANDTLLMKRKQLEVLKLKNKIETEKEIQKTKKDQEKGGENEGNEKV